MARLKFFFLHLFLLSESYLDVKEPFTTFSYLLIDILFFDGQDVPSCSGPPSILNTLVNTANPSSRQRQKKKQRSSMSFLS